MNLDTVQRRIGEYIFHEFLQADGRKAGALRLPFYTIFTHWYDASAVPAEKCPAMNQMPIESMEMSDTGTWGLRYATEF